MKPQYIYELRILCDSMSDIRKVHDQIPNNPDIMHVFINRQTCLPVGKAEDEDDWNLVKDLWNSNVGDGRQGEKPQGEHHVATRKPV
jgi:hypothetical protein